MRFKHIFLENSHCHPIVQNNIYKCSIEVTRVDEITTLSNKRDEVKILIIIIIEVRTLTIQVVEVFFTLFIDTK